MKKQNYFLIFGMILFILSINGCKKDKQDVSDLSISSTDDGIYYKSIQDLELQLNDIISIDYAQIPVEAVETKKTINSDSTLLKVSVSVKPKFSDLYRDNNNNNNEVSIEICHESIWHNDMPKSLYTTQQICGMDSILDYHLPTYDLSIQPVLCIKIAFHISNSVNISNTDLTNTITILNQYFEEAKLSFEIGQVLESPYSTFYADDPGHNNIPNMLNIYVGKTIKTLNDNNQYILTKGAAPFPIIDRDVAYVRAKHLTNSGIKEVLAHELGHFFSLYHTFESGYYQNLICYTGLSHCVSGVGFENQGDGICETPIDNFNPNLSIGPVFSYGISCSPVNNHNLMSYASGRILAIPCSYEFTVSQNARIRFAAGYWKSNLSCSSSPIPPIAEFSASSTNMLVGETVNYTDLSSNNPTSWNWSFDGGTPQTSSQQNPSITYNTPGTYQVSLTVTNSDGSDNETKTNYVTVSSSGIAPTSDFTADQTNVSVGTTVNFTDLSTGNPTSWNWSFDGGTPLSSTNQNPSIIYSTAGTYNVELTVTNAQGNDAEIKSSYITVSNLNNSFIGDVSLYTQQDVINFGSNNYSEIDGFLFIYGAGSTTDPITDLTPLSSLTSVSKHLYIYYTNSLLNLNGLNNIISIGKNPNWGTSIYDLEIKGNSALTDISALANTNYLGSYEFKISIDDNSSLTSIIGFNNFTSLENIIITDNISLNNINAFNNVNDVSYLFGLWGNVNLNTITGFNNLSTVTGNGILVNNNNSLQNIDFLNNTLSCTDIRIKYNASLIDLCGISNLVINNGIIGVYEVNNNLLNPSQIDIINGNCN